MAFADITTGGRVIKEGIGPAKLTLTADCKVGDLLTETGALADGNTATPARAKWVAGQTAVSGTEITVYKAAVISGVTGATLGNKVFLSDTAGGYSETVSTTQRQVVGMSLCATEIFVEPERMLERTTVIANIAAAEVVATVAAKVIYLATQRMRITKISEIHAVVAGQAGTLDFERLQGTEAPGAAAGDVLLGTTKVDLVGTIHTVQSPALTGTAANLVLEIGDRIVCKLATGAATSLAGGVVAVELEPA